jgi:hypothetical protein
MKGKIEVISRLGARSKPANLINTNIVSTLKDAHRLVKSKARDDQEEEKSTFELQSPKSTL